MFFFGFCSYYRGFVREFSKIASPLVHLLKADVMFEWTDKCMLAFQNLADLLTSEIVMAYPKDSGILILDTNASGTSEIMMAYPKDSGILIMETNASGTAIGTTLSQMQYCERSGTEEERDIAHASKSLTKAQR